MLSPLHLGGRFGRFTRDPFSAPIADLSGRCGRPRDRHSRPRGSRCSEARAPAISGLSLRGRGARFTRDAGNGRLEMGAAFDRSLGGAGSSLWALGAASRRAVRVRTQEQGHTARIADVGSVDHAGEAPGGGAADAISIRSSGFTRGRPAWTGRAWGGRDADMRWRPYRRGTRDGASWRHGRAPTRQASPPGHDRGHSWARLRAPDARAPRRARRFRAQGTHADPGRSMTHALGPVEVPLAPMSTHELRPVVSRAGWARLGAPLAAGRAGLQGRTVWMVNSTAVGGGVAELLRTFVPTCSAPRWTSGGR